MYIARTVALLIALTSMIAAGPTPEVASTSTSLASSCIKRSIPTAGDTEPLPGDLLIATPSNDASHPVSSVTGEADSSSSDGVTSPSAASGGSSTGSQRPKRDGKRFVAYWSIWHEPTQKPASLKALGITDVIMAFMYMKDKDSEPAWEPTAAVKFNDANIAALQAEGITVTAAIGGWGLDNVFRPATNTSAGREHFAQSLVSFVKAKGLDGIDLDWEYPGGNGQNYKLPESDPMSRGLDETDGPNFVLAAAEIRKQLDALGEELGKPMTLSIAVPSKPVDMIVYNKTEVTKGLDEYVDYWNLMTYDFINRRDSFTGNHAGEQVIADTLAIYSGFGIPIDKLNFGYPMYAKWFFTDLTQTSCPAPHIGCPFGVEFENATGGDTDKSAAMVFNAQIEMTTLGEAAHGAWSSFASSGEDSSEAPGGASTAIIETGSQNYFFTWVSKDDVAKSCAKHLPEAGGVFIWALNQDTDGVSGGPRFDAVVDCYKGVQ